MSTAGTLPPLAGPASPTTASVPVVAAIVGGSAAALALVILLSWLTRRDGAWTQQQRGRAEREANPRREVRARHAAENSAGTEVQPADLRPDLKRPTPFLVVNPGSEMLFGLKEIVVDPAEKAAATPKGSLELERCKSINASYQNDLTDHPAQLTAAASVPAASAEQPSTPSPRRAYQYYQNPFWVPAQLSPAASPR